TTRGMSAPSSSSARSCTEEEEGSVQGLTKRRVRVPAIEPVEVAGELLGRSKLQHDIPCQCDRACRMPGEVIERTPPCYPMHPWPARGFVAVQGCCGIGRAFSVQAGQYIRILDGHRRPLRRKRGHRMRRVADKRHAARVDPGTFVIRHVD